jgi:YVTN family beta-propeller protein
MRNYSVNWFLRVLIVRSFPMVTALSPFSFAGEANGYVIYVSNERSGDVTIIDGATDVVIATLSELFASRN